LTTLTLTDALCVTAAAGAATAALQAPMRSSNRRAWQVIARFQLSQARPFWSGMVDFPSTMRVNVA
jgi:hypothetical protein